MEFTPQSVYLLAPPHRVIARVALGVTVFLDDATAWAREGALASLRAFLDHAPRESLRWCATSAREGWIPLDGPTLERFCALVPLPWGRPNPRHGFRMRLVDEPDAPSVAWTYRETDPAHGTLRGHIQVILPVTSAPHTLEQLAIDLAQTSPITCGVGGHIATWSEAATPTVLPILRAWCLRYLGLDLPRPDVNGRLVDVSLPGTHWLTLLGPTLLAKLPATALSTPWTEDVDLHSLRHAVVVRAGEAPTLGDTNTLRYPAAYAEVAHRLAPLLPPTVRPFSHWREGQTNAWMRRFVDPEGWS